VFVNATTGKIYSVARKWRKVSPGLRQAVTVGREQATVNANRALGLDDASSSGNVIGLSLIQLCADTEAACPVRDVLVWRVGYSENAGMGFTEVSIDCQTGEVVRITGW